MELIPDFLKKLLSNSKKNIRKNTTIYSILKRKKIMFSWFWIKSLWENMTLLSKILKRVKNSMNFMKKLRFHYQLNRKSSNAEFVMKDHSKQMLHSILITESATTTKLLRKILKKENLRETKVDH